MKESNKRGEQFYRQWEERRKKKWAFIFLHGSIFWGLSVAIGIFLWRSNFKFENMQLSNLISLVIAFGIGGIAFGLGQFKRIDNIYLSLNDNDEIVKGIQILKGGDIWSYENLKICRENEGNLIIQNQLYWFDEHEISKEKFNECFNLVLGDYQRLQKSVGFSEFTRNKKVKIQIFDNSGSETPLFEKTIETVKDKFNS